MTEKDQVKLLNHQKELCLHYQYLAQQKSTKVHCLSLNILKGQPTETTFSNLILKLQKKIVYITCAHMAQVTLTRKYLSGERSIG